MDIPAWTPLSRPLLYLLAGALLILTAGLDHALTAWHGRPSTPLRLALPLLGVIGLWLGGALLAPDRSAPPATLPELTLEDLNGNAVALSRLAADPSSDRRPLIIHLWTTRCPPCRRDLPQLAAIDRRDDVRVVSINQGEDLLPIVRYLDNRGLTFSRVLRDPRQRLMARFNASRLPLTLLLDPRGRVQERHRGRLSRATLTRWLDD